MPEIATAERLITNEIKVATLDPCDHERVKNDAYISIPDFQGWLSAAVGAAPQERLSSLFLRLDADVHLVDPILETDEELAERLAEEEEDRRDKELKASTTIELPSGLNLYLEGEDNVQIDTHSGYPRCIMTFEEFERAYHYLKSKRTAQTPAELEKAA
jgi:hypothetical protein